MFSFKYYKFTHLFVLSVSVFLSFNAQARGFIGYGLPQVEIGGDMDGQAFVSGGGSTEIMPKHDTTLGQKISFGSYRNDMSFEVALVRSEHDGQWMGIPTESKYQSLNLDWKVSMIGSGDLRGLGILGIGFTSVEIEDGSVGSTQVEDATFKGMDIRFGLGIRYRIHDYLALDLSAVKRLGSYNHVDGVVSGSIDDDINGDGVTMQLDLMFLFPD